MRAILEDILLENGWNKADGVVNKSIRINGAEIWEAEWLGGELLGRVNGKIRNIVTLFEEMKLNKTVARAAFLSILRPV
jgi:hypothetical protein|nr:MAG TPA: hypothetical protein [Bacteriophage sp.]